MAQSLGEIFQQDPLARAVLAAAREHLPVTLAGFLKGRATVRKEPAMVGINELILSEADRLRVRRSTLKMPPAWRGSVRVPSWARPRPRWV